MNSKKISLVLSLIGLWLTGTLAHAGVSVNIEPDCSEEKVSYVITLTKDTSTTTSVYSGYDRHPLVENTGIRYQSLKCNSNIKWHVAVLEQSPQVLKLAVTPEVAFIPVGQLGQFELTFHQPVWYENKKNISRFTLRFTPSADDLQKPAYSCNYGGSANYHLKPLALPLGSTNQEKEDAHNETRAYEQSIWALMPYYTLNCNLLGFHNYPHDIAEHLQDDELEGDDREIAEGFDDPAELYGIRLDKTGHQSIEGIEDYKKI